MSDDLSDLKERAPVPAKPQYHKLTGVEARNHYENVLLAFVVLVWWFARDAWFNSSESMLKHKGFNIVGVIGFGFGLIYGLIMFTSAALTVWRKKLDASAAPKFVMHETRRWWIAFALCAGFVFFSWTHKEIDVNYNRVTAVPLVIFAVFSLIRWQRATRKTATGKVDSPTS